MPCSKGWLIRSYVKKDRNQVKQEHDVLYEGQYERIPAEVLQRIKSLEWNGEDLLIGNICVGTGVGNYKHYCERPTSTNDLHGVGAFLIMCANAQKALVKQEDVLGD